MSKPRHAARSAATARPHTLVDALADATPDLLAAIACGVAWQNPQAIGFDLLGIAGLLYFIELPLALLVGFAGVRRIADHSMGRATKRRFILLPTVALAILALLFLGPDGLIAVAWLGTLSLWRLMRESVDLRPAVRGNWLVFERRRGAMSFQLVNERPGPAKGRWIVPAGHAELMAGFTLALWFVVAALLMAMDTLPVAGATAEYASSVGWDRTVIGAVVPAQQALAAGVILFAARTLAHFEGIDATPSVVLDDDEVLRDIVAKIDGRPPARSAKSRRRRR